MAFRTPTYWKSMVSRLGGQSPTFATSTTPKMKSFALPLDLGDVKDARPGGAPPLKGDFVPVYVALGLIAMSASLGLYTAMHQLSRAPNVRVKKSMRETIPEVVVPELTVEEGDKFIKKSWFRKLAHIQEKDEAIVPDHFNCDILVKPPKAETLKDVGVDPKTQ